MPIARRHSLGIVLFSCVLSAPADSFEWRLTNPNGLRGAAMAFDSRRGVAVLFGGVGPQFEFARETWEWDGWDWLDRTPRQQLPRGIAPAPAWSLPSPRRDHALAYDAQRGVCVLFGGDARSPAPFGDTWEWDGANWFECPAEGPTPRRNHALAYDSARGVTVLFGGRDRSLNGETWERGTADWTLRAVSGPTPRYSHAMTYDSRRGVTVLVGGTDAAGLSNETWEWDGENWDVRAADGPASRDSHILVYDELRGVCVLQGGWDGTYFADTWEWDGATWSMRAANGPMPRAVHAAAYDSRRGATLLFGGQVNDPRDSLNGETWEWDGHTWLMRSGDSSQPSVNRAMIYDERRGAILLFGGGGRDRSNKLSAATWVCNDNTWKRIDVKGPSARTGHALAYDAYRGIAVLFGGETDLGIDRAALSGDAPSLMLRREIDRPITWEWNGVEWSPRDVPGPSTRWDHAMAYDDRSGAILLFGGRAGRYSVFGDTWVWDGDGWKLRTTAGPSPRYGHAMTYDPGREVVVLFGGVDANGNNGETWEWDGACWTLCEPAVRPTGRHSHVMAYDPGRATVVLFGASGRDPGSTLVNDRTWEWNGVEWKPGLNELAPNSKLRGSSNSCMVYDQDRCRMLLFGEAAFKQGTQTFQCILKVADPTRNDRPIR